MVYLQVVFLLHIGLWIILQSSLELVMVLEMVWEALQCWLESATVGSGEGLLIFTFDKIDVNPERIFCEVCFYYNYKPFFSVKRKVNCI